MCSSPLARAWTTTSAPNGPDRWSSSSRGRARRRHRSRRCRRAASPRAGTTSRRARPPRRLRRRTVGSPAPPATGASAPCRRRSRRSPGPTPPRSCRSRRSRSRAAAYTGSSVIDRRHDEIDAVPARTGRAPSGRTTGSVHARHPQASSAWWKALDHGDRSTASTRPSTPSRQRRAEPAEQLDPAAGRRDEDGERPPVTKRAGRSSGIVAWASWLMPDAGTRSWCPPRMRRSSATRRCSTYQTSRSSRRSHVMWFRPLTCAHPVTPGRTSSRRPSRGVYRST